MMNCKMLPKSARRGLTMISAILACLAMLLYFAPAILAQDGDGGVDSISLAPAEFTVRSLPLQKETYTIPQNLIVKNNADEAYLFSVSVEIPPENSVREGYQPIPSAEWLQPTPSSSFVIEANSYAVFQLVVTIPAEEQYTNQKWEAWVAVERVEPGSELVSARVEARVKLETAGEVTAHGNRSPLYIGLGIGLPLLVLILALFFWMRKRRKSGEAT